MMMKSNLMFLLALWSATAPWTCFSFQIPVHHVQSSSNLLLTTATVASSSSSSSVLYMSDNDDSDTKTINRMSIEYCTGCRWMLKSFWMAQEVLMTFENELDAITILPSPTDTTGVYTIKLNGNIILWDRKEQGGFPSTKELKQLLRDQIIPDKFLGHSDTKDRQQKVEGQNDDDDDEDDASTMFPLRGEELTSITLPESEVPSPCVTITYCTGCRWMLRAAYMGQELLTTFGDVIKSVTLVPSKPPSKGGQFCIKLDGECLFDRATEGRFPEVKEIKQMIRDKLVPDKDLGHSDVKQDDDVDDGIDDEEAEAQRKMFGVA